MEGGPERKKRKTSSTKFVIQIGDSQYKTVTSAQIIIPNGTTRIKKGTAIKYLVPDTDEIIDGVILKRIVQNPDESHSKSNSEDYSIISSQSTISSQLTDDSYTSVDKTSEIASENESQPPGDDLQAEGTMQQVTGNKLTQPVTGNESTVRISQEELPETTETNTFIPIDENTPVVLLSDLDPIGNDFSSNSAQGPTGPILLIPPSLDPPSCSKKNTGSAFQEAFLPSSPRLLPLQLPGPPLLNNSPSFAATQGQSVRFSKEIRNSVPPPDSMRPEAGVPATPSCSGTEEQVSSGAPINAAERNGANSSHAGDDALVGNDADDDSVVPPGGEQDLQDQLLYNKPNFRENHEWEELSNGIQVVSSVVDRSKSSITSPTHFGVMLMRGVFTKDALTRFRHSGLTWKLTGDGSGRRDYAIDIPLNPTAIKAILDYTRQHFVGTLGRYSEQHFQDSDVLLAWERDIKHALTTFQCSKINPPKRKPGRGGRGSGGRGGRGGERRGTGGRGN